MSFNTKLKLWFTGVLALCLFIGYFLLNMEFVQKKIFDAKADVIGSNRSITFYAQMTGEKLTTYQDKDLRYEVSPNGETISVWLGSINKKVHSNMGYIIEDIK